MTKERPRFEVVSGKVIDDRVVPPGEPWGGVVRRGRVLRIVDLEGQQAVDFLCYNADDPSERYNAANTMKFAGNIFLTKGRALQSSMGRPLFTVVEDTCGFHDTIAGCCSAEGNLALFGAKNTPNCRDNFLHALARFGLGKKDIVANVNFFMTVPVGPAGEMAIAEGRSKPGDFVDLRAEMDALAMLSNCPQVLNPAAGYNPTPVRVILWEPG